MAIVGNNTNSEYANLRDSFFTEEEKKQFNKVMKDEKDQKIHAEMLEKKASLLYKKAMQLINRVEAGEFNEKQMKKVEYVISHLLAGIEDLHKELILELTMDHNVYKGG